MSTTPARVMVIEGPDTSLRIALPDFANLTLGSAAEDTLRLALGTTRLRLYVDHGLGVELLGGSVERLPAASPDMPERLKVGRTVDLELGDRLRLDGLDVGFLAAEESEPCARRLAPAVFRDLVSEATAGVLGLVRLSSAPKAGVDALLGAQLDPGELFASHGEGRVLVFMPGRTAPEAERWAARLAGAARREGLELWASFGTDTRVATAATRLEERLQAPQLADAGAGLDASGDPEMMRVLALVERAAQGSGHVLLLGETGVGKDRVAQFIHERSPRNAGPYVKLSGLELSDALEGRNPGTLLDRARGGTLYLDELLGLSMRAQLAFGHLLDEGLGTGHDVRIVASSNQDLQAAVRAGTLRKDLFFRLDQVSIALPALRDRARAILPLARSFLEQLAARSGRAAPRLSEGADARLVAHGWPGNVRELRNVMERALLLVTGEVLGVEHLPPGLGLPSDEPDAPLTAERAPTPADGAAPGVSLRDELQQLEKRRIIEALKKYPTQREAAEALEMPMRTFLNRLDALNIPRARGGGQGKKRDDEEE